VQRLRQQSLHRRVRSDRKVVSDPLIRAEFLLDVFASPPVLASTCLARACKAHRRRKLVTEISKHIEAHGHGRR
jgi:hypothetical protein